MFELMICSLVTILPDYLYRRYVQNKRFGKEITFYSVWYELRWGIIGCLMLTISLITMIFYFHPSTTSATLFFRTVPILPEASGRVAEINVGFSAAVSKGDVIFRLDSSKQQAALETAKRKIAEVDAAMVTGEADVTKAEAQIQEAKSVHQQARDELDVKSELQRRNPGIVPQRDIEKLQVLVDQRQAGIDVAAATKQSHGFRRSCRRKRRAPKRPWRRHRWIWTRPLSVPGLLDGSNSSRSAQAMSSIHSCGPRGFSSRKALASGCCRPGSARLRLKS
jgi:multidrug resistance efflux pump